MTNGDHTNPAPPCANSIGPQPMRPALRLVVSDGQPTDGRPRSESLDTIECLRSLLERACRGEVVGLVYAAIASDTRFSVNTCGRAKARPGYGVSVSAALHYYLVLRRAKGRRQDR